MDVIAERLFWDLDFLEEGTFADPGPRECGALKRLARIADGCFSRPPPLVRQEDYRKADRYLRRAAGCLDSLDPWDGKGF